MAGFADLVLQAQPSLVDRCLASATEGRSWRWEITGFVDTAGNPVDFTTASITCQVQDKVDGASVIFLACDGAPGKVTLTAAPANTAGTANGKPERNCVWSLKIADAGGSQIQVWSPAHSLFKIEAE